MALVVDGVDAYVRRMTTCDLNLLRVSSHAQAKQLYVSRLRPCSPVEAASHDRMFAECRRLFSAAECRVLASMPRPRTLMMTTGDDPWFPHTVGGTIVFTAPPSLGTVCHEIVHVFQRAHPVLTDHLVTAVLGYRRVMRAGRDVREALRIRANPDVDDYLYSPEGVADGRVCAQVYDRACPSSLADSRTVVFDAATHVAEDFHGYEHPYEHMAYALTDMVMVGRVPRAWAALL